VREDGLWLEYREVVWFAGALDMLAKYAKRAGCAVPSSVISVRAHLDTYLGSRTHGRGDATTRPAAELLVHPEDVDANEASERLGITADAVRKACRTGRFAAVARKQRGQWRLPAADVEAEGTRNGDT